MMWNLVGTQGLQTGENISITPAGNVSATTVQDAIEELDTEKLRRAGNYAILKSVHDAGIKIDETTPVYSWADLKGHFIVNTTGANAPVLTDFGSGVYQLGYNASDIAAWQFHIEHRDVIGGIKYGHPHIGIASGATTSGSNLVIDFKIRHVMNSIGAGDARGAVQNVLTLQMIKTPAELNAIGNGKEQAFDVAFANSGGTGGLLNSDKFWPDDLLFITLTVSNIPTISGGSTNRISISHCDIHREVRDGSGTLHKDATSGSFYGTT